MKSRLRFLLSYLAFWTVYFLIFRGIFLIYHYDQSSDLSIGLLAGTFLHGVKMDLSFSAYLSLLVFLLVALSTLWPQRLISKSIKWYTLPVMSLVTFLCVADLGLFTEWGFRLDATPLTYVDTPREMAISASSSPYVLLIFSIVGITAVSFWLYKLWVHGQIYTFTNVSGWTIIPFLLLTASLVIPIRGGFQLAPLNQSVAFFSRNDFANQSALNVPWNVFRSITKEVYSKENPFRFKPDSAAKADLWSIYPKDSLGKATTILSTPKPNVVLIIWESLTSKASHKMGGDYQGVLPQLEQLMTEGVFFRNFYASGERSDKGLVSILSGYPAQPHRSIVKIPNKASKLPVLSQDFNDQGYHTSFYHGGELEFANIKSYLIHGEFKEIVGKEAFDRADMNSKWGAHDHVVFQKAFEDINQYPQPFFSTIFTLSSHEPFEIPIDDQFPGDTLESLYLNSLYYSDQSLGEFIKTAKEQPWYDQTLFIVLADHGHRLLIESGRYQWDKYHVPMLWFGGALQVRDTVINRYCSQTDVARTLGLQLGFDVADYPWSRDIFASQYFDGAFYVFNQGISLIQPQGQLIYDAAGTRLLDSTDYANPTNIELAKSHLQATYADYLNK